ncbi:MAG: TonB-dependent receptor [Proteobacteria bacterium]|nr:MAG: TonB-dependent receptor [Pseudomonadota bacterium]
MTSRNSVGPTTDRRAIRSQRVTLAVRVALASSLASSAFAQAPEQSTQGSGILGEVVVTAQFREQNVQDTPLAITAVSAELLESRNQTNITEITSQAPNVTLKQQGATFGPSIAASIRGIGQSDFNPALEPGVGIYVDDVYYATLTGGVLDLLDLERVEILRGPQGTLAGRNSIGGAVKLYSRKPNADDGGYFSATYGSRDRIDLRGSANFALSDNLFLRLSGVDKSQNGYIARVDYGCANPNNPYGIPAQRATSAGCIVDYDSDVNFTAARAALRWVASDDLEFNFSADYTTDRRNPTGTVLVDYRAAVSTANTQPVVDDDPSNNVPVTAFIVPHGSYYNYASYYNPPGTYNGVVPVQGAFDTSFNGTVLQNYPLLESRADPGQFFEGWGTALTVDWTLSDSLALKSITAYRSYDSGFTNDNDLSPLSSSIGDGTLPFHSFSQELRLNGAAADDRVEYTLGAFYMDQRSRYQSWQDLRYTPNYPLQFQQDDIVNADTQAVFAHLAFHPTDQLSLTGGLRYTEEHKDYTFVRLTRDGAVHPFLGTLNGVSSVYDGDNLDYRVAVQYRWTTDLMTYVQYSTGFKGGGVSPRPFVPEQALPFDPEELTSYELGMKVDFFDRRVRLNSALFYSDYTDLQLGLQLCPGAPCGVIANAGDATIKGVELEAVLRPVAGLSIDASFSYLDFEYDRLSPQVTAYELSYIAPYMPERKWSVGAQYEFILGDLGTLTPRVDVSYQGEMYTNGNNQPTNFIEDYTLLNARLTWRSSAGDWEASLEGTNLTDKYYFLTRTDQFSGAGHTDGQPGRPREWAVTLKRNF